MNKKYIVTTPAFTVIEFLVVVGIMAVLIGITLASINLSRARARDDARVSDIQTIVVALEQFRDECRQYPHTLEPSDDADGACDTTLGDVLQNPPTARQSNKIMYTGVRVDASSSCAAYHIGVALETDHSVLRGDADFDSHSLSTCTGSTPPATPDYAFGVFSADDDETDKRYDMTSDSMDFVQAQPQ